MTTADMLSRNFGSMSMSSIGVLSSARHSWMILRMGFQANLSYPAA